MLLQLILRLELSPRSTEATRKDDIDLLGASDAAAVHHVLEDLVNVLAREA